MITDGGQSSNIKEANPTRPSKTFLVARLWQSDWPPHNGCIQTIHLRTSTARNIKPDMWAGRGGIPSTKGCQVDDRWVPIRGGFPPPRDARLTANGSQRRAPWDIGEGVAGAGVLPVEWLSW